ncbi:C39 family peptidase [Rhodococcus spongiicola]|uniref:Peptidase C39-like domain-containing protein n=1 Tax=Rhodococcus spongiicola TaxID=2487352 RepID=A0A3S3E3D5_9NOCA|nr:C39 family peptidase [Rhodococcus spongiicola]RVW04440.1 hypothetical protein EF834_04985 [Rhodococcus spongiicola]
MDDFDQDSVAAAWSGAVADPAVVIDEPTDFDPIPAGLDLPPEIDTATTPPYTEAPAPVEDTPELTDPTPQQVPEQVDEIDEIDLTVPDDGVYGNPAAWTLGWFFQQFDGYCGPSAVAQVVSQYTGAEITDPQQLVDRAIDLGLMDDPSLGMTLADIETLLEDQGVPATITTSSLDDLRDRLDAGYGVIAMVDSGEIWQTDPDSEDDLPDHVLVVAGIDDNRGVVILSDPGIPTGNQLEVPIAQFEDAWADGDHLMLITDAPDDGLITGPALSSVAPSDRSAIIRL